MTIRKLAAALALIAIAACSPQTATSAMQDVSADGGNIAIPELHPVSGLDVVPLIVDTGETSYAFHVEVARTAEEQAKGLMFRTQLAPHEGMIFPRTPPDIASFWMKNTPLPLDIVFVGTDGRILNIAANTTPYSTQSVAATGMTALVLELAGGRAAELGIEPGDRVSWEDRSR